MRIYLAEGVIVRIYLAEGGNSENIPGRGG